MSSISITAVLRRQARLGEKWQLMRPNRDQLLLAELEVDTWFWLFDSTKREPDRCLVTGITMRKPEGENLVTYLRRGVSELTTSLAADLGLEPTNAGLWNQHCWCRDGKLKDPKWPTS